MGLPEFCYVFPLGSGRSAQEQVLTGLQNWMSEDFFPLICISTASKQEDFTGDQPKNGLTCYMCSVEESAGRASRIDRQPEVLSVIGINSGPVWFTGQDAYRDANVFWL